MPSRQKNHLPPNTNRLIPQGTSRRRISCSQSLKPAELISEPDGRTSPFSLTARRPRPRKWFRRSLSMAARCKIPPARALTSRCVPSPPPPPLPSSSPSPILRDTPAHRACVASNCIMYDTTSPLRDRPASTSSRSSRASSLSRAQTAQMGSTRSANVNIQPQPALTLLHAACASRSPRCTTS